MDWLQFAVQWLHVLGGILWFGSSLTFNFIVVPALLTLPFAQQPSTGAALGRMAERVIRPAAALVIILGILR